MATENIFANLPTDLPEELIQQIAGSRGVRIERIVSRGHASPEGFWYDQPDHEWVILLAGRAKLLLAGDDEPIVLSPGDYLDIPAHTKHRVEWTDPDRETVWLAVHYH